MSHICHAVVAITVEVQVDGIHAHWSLDTAHDEARDRALKRAREVCKELGKVTRIKVTAVVAEHEEEPVPHE